MRTSVREKRQMVPSNVAGDYLDVTGPGSSTELLRLVEAALDVPPSVWDLSGPFPWARLDSSINIVVEYGSAGDGTARIAVADYEHQAPRRNATTERLRRVFSQHPGWAVTYSTDGP